MAEDDALSPQTPVSLDPPLEALFHTFDSRAFSVFLAMGVGAAGIASGSAAGPASDAILKLFEPSKGTKALPHWVVIRVQPSSVQFFASNRHGVHGDDPVAEFRAGSFGAVLTRNIGEVDLSLFPKKGDSVSLKGKWGPFHTSQMKVARAIVALSQR